jgi:hypothetical protein
VMRFAEEKGGPGVRIPVQGGLSGPGAQRLPVTTIGAEMADGPYNHVLKQRTAHLHG